MTDFDFVAQEDGTMQVIARTPRAHAFLDLFEVDMRRADGTITLDAQHDAHNIAQNIRCGGYRVTIR